MRAGEVPLAVARDSAKILALASEMAAIGNANAVTDAGAAANLAQAALRSAGLNVKVNASGLSDQELAERWLAEVAELETAAGDQLAVVGDTVNERAGITA